MEKVKITKNGASKQNTIPKSEIERAGILEEDQYAFAHYYPYRPVFQEVLTEACRKDQPVEIIMRDKDQTKKTGVPTEVSQTNVIIFNKELDHGEDIPFNLIKNITEVS
jgi:hypothetical protein